MFLEVSEVLVFCCGWCYWCHGVVMMVVVCVLIGALESWWVLLVADGRLVERGWLPPRAGYGRLWGPVVEGVVVIELGAGPHRPLLHHLVKGHTHLLGIPTEFFVADFVFLKKKIKSMSNKGNNSVGQCPKVWGWSARERGTKRFPLCLSSHTRVFCSKTVKFPALVYACLL